MEQTSDMQSQQLFPPDEASSGGNLAQPTLVENTLSPPVQQVSELMTPVIPPSVEVFIVPIDPYLLSCEQPFGPDSNLSVSEPERAFTHLGMRTKLMGNNLFLQALEIARTYFSASGTGDVLSDGRRNSLNQSTTNTIQTAVLNQSLELYKRP
eukprot:2069694-Pyramimonas_sp.AAC.1